MNDIVNIAKKFISNGYSVIPVSKRKTPTIPSWNKYKKEPMTIIEAEEHFKNAWGIALLCGGKSRVFCLDADMKYDLSGDLFERFKKSVSKELLKKMYFQKTMNNGFHLCCIVPKNCLRGNEKFASRETTVYEKHQTYIENFNDPTKRDKALNIAIQDKTRVLFESRSGSENESGGYFLLPPSPGYEKIYGKFQEITEDEYEELTSVARSFNEVIDVIKPVIKHSENIDWMTTPFEDYNANGDVINLLLRYGWDISHESNSKIRLKRPGKVYSKDSAIFNKESNILNVFTTSTSFDVSKGYNPSQILSHLEFNDDMKETYQHLINLGYGKKK